MGAVDARIDTLRRTVEKMSGPCACEDTNVGDRFVHGYGLAVYRAALKYLEEHSHEIVSLSLFAERAVAE